MKKTVFASLLLLTLSGCTGLTKPEISSHGYIPIEEKISYVGAGNFTQKDVAQVFGEPFLIGVYDASYWYYIQYKTEQYGFGKEKITNFNVLELYFEGGYLQNINRFDKSTLRSIEMTAKQSPTYGKESSVLQEIIRNVGRFRTQQTTF